MKNKQNNLEIKIETLIDQPIFKNIKIEQLNDFIENSHLKIEEYKENELIIKRGALQNNYGFILEGVLLFSVSNNEGNLRNVNFVNLKKVLATTEFKLEDNIALVDVYCLKKAKILWIKRNDFNSFYFKNENLRNNYLKMQLESLDLEYQNTSYFINKDYVKKVYKYLFDEINNQEQISKTNLAQALRISRSSLYRALNILKKRELIKIENEKIIIIGPKYEEIFDEN